MEELRKELFELLEKNQLELVRDGNKLLVISAETVRPTVKQLLQQYLASVPLEIEYKIGPKDTTYVTLQRFLYQLSEKMHCPISNTITSSHDGHHLIVKLSCSSRDGEECDELDSIEVWENLCKILSKDAFFESWEFQDFTFNRAVAKELATHKPGTKVISKETVEDVHILVNAYNTVEEFLAHV